MGAIKASRRKILGLFASAPLAAKAAADEIIAKQVGLNHSLASGMAQLGGGIPPGASLGEQTVSSAGVWIPHEERMIRAADFIKIAGIPEVVQAELRRNSKWVGALDPDIAAKKSWSMSVKIQHQRQRNYDNMIESIQFSSWQHKKRRLLDGLLGFQWPF